jgi:hypothetical protein
MNEFLLYYLALQNKVKYEGKLILFIGFNKEVVVRCEYFSSVIYVYDESFSQSELDCCLVDVITLAIERANKQFEGLLNSV